MDKSSVCDFCGRPGTISQFQNLNGQRQLEMDEDGLWVCSECKTKLIGKPTGDVEEQDIAARETDLLSNVLQNIGSKIVL